MKQIRNTGELWSTTKRRTKQNIKRHRSEGGTNISVSISAGQKCHRWERDFIHQWLQTQQIITAETIHASVYTFSLSTYEPRRNKFAFIRPSPPPSGLCLEKTRCGAGLCLNSSTSNSTAVLQQVRVFFKQTRFSLEPLGCRSHAGHEWLHRLESRVPSSPARSEKQKQRQKKTKKNTHPHLDPGDADRGRNHKFR